MESEEIEGRLRGAGLRVTAGRVAVLSVLARADDHPRVDQVIERVRASGVPMSIQAGYDVCEALHRAELARRIALAGGPVRYEAQAGDNHHHLVCRSCGRAIDVPCQTGHAPCVHLPDPRGFTVDEAEITFWGTCPDCTTTHHSTPEARSAA